MKRSDTMENDYHNPYDHRPLGLVKSTNNSDSDQTANLYEAPSCLVRNPSGSLFIPSSTGKYYVLWELCTQTALRVSKDNSQIQNTLWV